MSKMRDWIKYFYYRFRETICVNYIYRYFSLLRCGKKYSGHKKTIYIVTTPEYGNLGDHAIAQAEIDFTRKKYQDYELMEIPDSAFDRNIECLSRFTNEDDVIFLIGGGNFGMLYRESEYIRRTVIRKCKRCKIVMFPQSSTYSNSKFDSLELKRSIRLYSAHSKLYLLARDHKTYAMMQQAFYRNHVFLVPDIVLTWNIEDLINQKQTGNKRVLFCIRKDLESKADSDLIDRSFRQTKQKGLSIDEFDTETYRKINANMRIEELVSALDKFIQADYVITDRLHGMVLACLTGTPCLAFDNSTGKVSGQHTWISNPEIMLYNPDQDISQQIEMLLEKEKFRYNSAMCYNIMSDTLDRII